MASRVGSPRVSSGWFMDAFKPQLVTVFGATGFIGRYVVRALAKRGYRIRAATRRPDLAGHLQPMGHYGQIVPVQANLRYPWSVDRAVEGADHVVNLVGILASSGKQTFDSVQRRGSMAVADAAVRENASLTQVSAIGASMRSEAEYARSKAQAEQHIRDVRPDAVILRPSVVFGPEDDFFNRFAAMARISPFLPIIGGGRTRFQPVYVGDIAEAVARSVDGRARPGTTYELGGPDVATFRECMELLLKAIDRRRLLLPVPFWAAKLLAGVAQYAPGQPLTPDQVVLLRSDNVVGEPARREGRTLQGLGIEPASMAAVIPTYLVRFRPYGQYEPSRGL